MINLITGYAGSVKSMLAMGMALKIASSRDGSVYQDFHSSITENDVVILDNYQYKMRKDVTFKSRTIAVSKKCLAVIIVTRKEDGLPEIIVKLIENRFLVKRVFS